MEGEMHAFTPKLCTFNQVCGALLPHKVTPDVEVELQNLCGDIL